MTHIRTQVRAAAVSALSALTTTATRVFTGRPYPLQASERPGLVVEVLAERVEVVAMNADPTLLRTLQLTVIGYTEGDDIEDRLDVIGAEVEAALGANPTLGGVALDTTLSAVDLDVDSEGTKRQGEIRMTFMVMTRTTRAVPTVFV